ncbi:MAG: hypothetical protein ABGY43_19490 [bacterium]
MLRILKISLLVSVVVLLNAMTTLLFVQNAVPASAGPQCVDGDVNGDAAVDITDPIYLLSYIFGGGPEPVACAQQPSGVTAAELDFITGKYNGVPDSIAALLPSSTGTAITIVDGFTIPPGKLFVATSLHASPLFYNSLSNTQIWFGKNWDPTIGYPNGTQVNVNDPGEMTALVASGLVAGSARMGDFEAVSAQPGGNGSGYTSWHARRDMKVVYREGDVLSLVKVWPQDEISVTINGYWLNAD